MQNELKTMYLKEKFLGNVYASGSVETRVIRENGENHSFRAYSAMSDNVTGLTIYTKPNAGVATVEPFSQLELKNAKLVPMSNSMQVDSSRRQFYEYVIHTDSVGVVGGEQGKLSKNPDRLLALKFTGGNVTEACDVKKTFGDFLFLGAEAVYLYDEDGVQSDEADHYEMIVLSRKTKKQYKVKVDNLLINFDAFNPGDEVALDISKITYYHDSSRQTSGATVSIKAKGVTGKTDVQPDKNKHQSAEKADVNKK